MGNSYSSAGRGKWMCPYCGADLSEVTPVPAGSIAEETGAKVKGNVIPLKKRSQEEII